MSLTSILNKALVVVWIVGLSVLLHAQGQPVTPAAGATFPVTCSADCNVNIDKVANTAVVADPCWSATKSIVSINQTGNTRIVIGTTAKKVYVCAFLVIAGAAESVALVEGTGATCGTNTVGFPGFGGATAATGLILAAKTPINYGSGGSAIGAESVAADDVCLFQAGGAQVSGGLVYVVQ